MIDFLLGIRGDSLSGNHEEIRLLLLHEALCRGD